MKRRKLQIFLSSTYEDLVNHRLAAMEAILAAGHVPAAMEQFAPGDETAWEKIRSWIDESDGFILILGGRYGSIEPSSGKSYVQLEYEYALENKKPFFALVIKEEHHEQRVREFGLAVDEREHPEQYARFKRMVTERLCRFWGDKKDIQAAIFQKLPEWAQRPDLVGWIRGDQAPSARVMDELARLSHENRELREILSTRAETFDGLTFEEMVRSLRRDAIPEEVSVFNYDSFLQEFPSSEGVRRHYLEPGRTVVRHAGHLFEIFNEVLSTKGIGPERVESRLAHLLGKLIFWGLVSRDDYGNYLLSEQGRRFRNRMLMAGDIERRRNLLWTSESEEESGGPNPGSS